jgi:hypothetical protein
MALSTVLGQVDSEKLKALPGRIRNPERIKQHLDAFGMYLQGVSFRGIQEHFGWKSVSTAENSVKRGELLAKDLNLDSERIRLKLAAYFDEILDITMQQVKEQAKSGRVTIDVDPEGKQSMRCTKGVDPRLLGEAGRGAIRFAQFVGLMDDTASTSGGDVSTNVVFISPTSDGATWDSQVQTVDVTANSAPSEHESGHDLEPTPLEPSPALERPTALGAVDAPKSRVIRRSGHDQQGELL